MKLKKKKLSVTPQILFMSVWILNVDDIGYSSVKRFIIKRWFSYFVVNNL